MNTIDRVVTHAQKVGWLALLQAPGIGPLTFYSLYGYHSSPKDAYDHYIRRKLKSQGGKEAALLPFKALVEKAEHELEQCCRRGIEVIGWYETDYPELLKHIHAAPPFIRVWGKKQILSQPCVGVVGARQASQGAKKLAEQIAGDLGCAGIVCISGLARGIDTWVHKGSLETGTIAVLAGGVDVVYPPENQKLYEAICQKGAVVSEMPLGTKPLAHYFPRRNRIISGLSYGTLVVEATLASGSLITAKYALDQGRDVFAVPGFPLDPRSSGTNALLRAGAVLVERAEDIIGCLSGFAGLSGIKSGVQPSPENHIILPQMQSSVDNIHTKIIEMLSHVPILIDQLVCEMNEPCEQVLAALAELELSGKIERHPGQSISRLYN